MNQPPRIPNIIRMRRLNRQVKHLLRLLERDDVGDEAEGTVGLFDAITGFQVACTDPVGIQVGVAFGGGTLGGVSILGEVEGVL